MNYTPHVLNEVSTTIASLCRTIQYTQKEKLFFRSTFLMRPSLHLILVLDTYVLTTGHP